MLKLAAVVLLVTVVPVLTIVILLFGSGAATTAIFGVLVGMLNIVLGGRNTAFAASFALIIMAPISVMAGLNPVTGAAVMAISCLAIGASAGWGLQRGLSMLLLAIAFLIISPLTVSNTPTDRISTPYLLTVVAIMAISSLIPVIVLTFLLRHKELPSHNETTGLTRSSTRSSFPSRHRSRCSECLRSTRARTPSGSC